MGGGISSPLLGERAAVVVVELDEAVGELDQRPAVDVPLDEMPPAQHDAVPRSSRFQHVGVAVQTDVVGCTLRTSGGREPVFPRRPVLVGPCEIEEGEPAPAADGSAEDFRVGLGIAERSTSFSHVSHLV